MQPSFDSLRVLILESRRAKELASIVVSYGGQPLIAPSLREVPLESNTEALAFVDRLVRREVDLVILLTGVGTRALLQVVESAHGTREAFVDGLRAAPIVARGPKPVAVLRELGLQPWIVAPEPNTWREVLAALDARRDERPLSGLRVAVQEYGASNPDLLAGLEERGAKVTPVPVYQWALPEDIEPLKSAVLAVSAGFVEVALFTSATQVVHLFKVAAMLEKADDVRRQLSRMIVASIGPTTSEELRRRAIGVDLEPSHPKMGFLVRETAEKARQLLRAKRGT